ncbi:MAG: EamA family transporter [Sphingobacteriales bacterium]|nr:EamA family transporter [Sphingobacteriales bacterium]
MSHQHRKRALASVALISFTWGTTWLASKLAVTEYHMPPLQTGALRFTLAGIIFLTYFFIRGYRLPGLKQLGKLIILSCFFLVFSNGLTLQALAFPGMSSGIGSVVGATVPLWVAMLSIFILRNQKLTIQIFIGLILGFGGIIIIFADDLHAFANPKFEKSILLLVLASLSWSIGTLFNAKKDKTIDPFYSLGWQMFLCGLLLFVWSYKIETMVPLTSIDYHVWLCIAYLIIIGSAISFVAYIYALKHLPAAQVSIYAYINPIIALILGFFWRHEQLNWYIALGALVTLMGVYLVNNAFNKQPEIEDQAD